MNKLLLILCIFPFITSCGVKPNVSIFEKDNIRLAGAINNHSQSTYHTFWLGTYNKPLNTESCKIGIDLSQSKKALISDITIELLISNGFARRDYSYIEGFPQGALSFSKNGYNFITYNQKIYEVIISNSIWNENFTKKFEIPISHDDAVKLFGEPDSAYQTVSW